MMTSPPDAATINAFATAAVAVLGAFFAGVVIVIKALRETQRAVVTSAVASKDARAVSDQKLNTITLLVNGRYAAVLRELAQSRHALARVTGLPADQEKATQAQRRADEQDWMTTQLMPPTEGLPQ